MKRIKVKQEVQGLIDWDYLEVSIEKLEQDISLLKESGITHVEFDAEESWGSATLIIKPYILRTETDEEFQLRKDKLKKQEEAQLKRDREIFDRLRKKFD